MNPSQFAQLPPELRGELERRIKASKALRTARRFLADLHPKQRRFVLDKSRRKVAVCSRRAGKSHGILAWLIDGALDDPGGLSVYVARSKGDAMRIMGPAIDLFARRYPELQLKLREIDGQRLLVVGLTRHNIWLAGCKDQSEVGKFRGAGNGYKRVAIDEAQEYGAFLRDLITGAIEPALVDKKGELLLAGTPGPVPAGIFYEVSTGDGAPQWPTHHWTIFDNPHIRDAAEEIRLFCATYGLDKDSPTFRREYLGVWVRDDGVLVYPYSANINACLAHEVPEGGHLVLSLDFGVVDATAFTVLKTVPGAPEVWVLRSWSKTGLIPSAVAAHVERLIAEFGRGMQIVGDEGGLGKGYAEEMRQRYGIGITAAEKTKKRAFQEIAQGELRSGTIKIVASECHQLIDEMCLLQWAPGKLKEDERFENHCCDSMLYGVRAARAWYRPEVEAPAPGTPEWWAAEQARTRAEMRKRAEQRAKKVGGLRR
ncbi:MAG TPA: hypothetical protein VER96_33770 [Polyangiaceae bacterium]|nr:hypothetical protein [Polyangiaceae bacterium]